VSVSVDPGPRAPEWPRGIVGSAGLPSDVSDTTLVAPFNDLLSVERILADNRRELAAVIVEPETVRGMIPADLEFLRGLRDLTRAMDVLLILDEVVTFRLSEGGAQQRYAVTPDLTTMRKIIGGGLPVGAFGGRADVMAGFDPSHAPPIHHSGTFAGNSAVMAAGLAAMSLLTPAAYVHLDSLGHRLRDGLRSAARSAGIGAEVTGLGSLAAFHLTKAPVRNYRDALRSDREALRWLHIGLLNRGVFGRAGESFFLSTPMTNADVDTVVAAVADTLLEVRRFQEGQSC
jgi:glutamate-1-semialdehyde 2,1-aminomutase